jgi:hypothetical protein
VAAEVRVDDVAGGLHGSARVEYDFDYLDAMGEALDERTARVAASLAEVR